jgi:predicted nucleotidyltransferase
VSAQPLAIAPNGRKPSIRAAKAIARKLGRAFPSIDGISLYGSVARGDATPWSDIDLLVIGSQPRLSPARLKDSLPPGVRDRTSIIFYPTTAFRRHYEERALFIAHIRKEGKILLDRRGILGEVLGRPFVPAVDIEEGIATHLVKLAPYANVRRFGGNFLFCLAHLYSIGKGIAMLGLAKAGPIEFNRDRAFRRFERLNPDLRREVRKVRALRPFYNLVTGRRPEPLPFSYLGAERPTREAVAAIRALAKRVKEE